MRPSPFQRNATRTPLQHCGTLRYAGCAYLQVCSGRDITVVAEATKKTYVIQWEKWSERGDLNSRPPVPQTGALTGLRYAPTIGIGRPAYTGSPSRNKGKRAVSCSVL